MTTGHRYRLIIYFAALVLCLSVCFAYAEEPAASIPSASIATSVDTAPAVAESAPGRLLFNSAPGRSSFMPTLTATLVAEAAAPAAQPVYADAALQALTVRENKSHGFVHSLFQPKHKLKLVTQHAAERVSSAQSSDMMVAGQDQETQQ
jgi:hypothetical protein